MLAGLSSSGCDSAYTQTHRAMGAMGLHVVVGVARSAAAVGTVRRASAAELGVVDIVSCFAVAPP